MTGLTLGYSGLVAKGDKVVLSIPDRAVSWVAHLRYSRISNFTAIAPLCEGNAPAEKLFARGNICRWSHKSEGSFANLATGAVTY